jgi:hypothetical protein
LASTLRSGRHRTISWPSGLERAPFTGRKAPDRDNRCEIWLGSAQLRAKRCRLVALSCRSADTSVWSLAEGKADPAGWFYRVRGLELHGAGQLHCFHTVCSRLRVRTSRLAEFCGEKECAVEPNRSAWRGRRFMFNRLSSVDRNPSSLALRIRLLCKMSLGCRRLVSSGFDPPHDGDRGWIT